MTALPAMLREFMGAPKREFCSCEVEQFELVAAAARSAISFEKGFLKSFRKAFYSQLASHGWHLEVEFGNFPRMGRARAAVTIDAVLNFPCSDCEHHHRIFVEMCTDNRQAILANLMKLEFASRRFLQNYPAGVSTGVGVFISEDRKKDLKSKNLVDGAIGSREEYEIQATGPWDGLITTNLLALSI